MQDKENGGDVALEAHFVTMILYTDNWLVVKRSDDFIVVAILGSSPFRTEVVASIGYHGYMSSLYWSTT